jgi:hypothetical protein
VEFALNSDKPSRGSKAGDRLALIFLVLFALPFAGMGMAAAIKGANLAMAGKLKDGLGLLAIGLVFSGFGFGLLVGLVFAAKAKKRTDAIKAAHPDEPWLWRDDWAAGRIPSADKRSVVTAWTFAVFWNLVSSTVFFILPGELRKGNHKVLVALLFPIVGLGLLALAIQQSVRWRKFGQSIYIYYDVHVTNHSGRNLVAASAIKDKREADWLVSEMQQALKLEKRAWSPAIKLAGN